MFAAAHEAGRLNFFGDHAALADTLAFTAFLAPLRKAAWHVLPKGLHRIRHYGLFASADRAANIERARQLLAAPSRSKNPEKPNATATDAQHILPRPCPCCGGHMIIIETFKRGCQPKYRPTSAPVTIRIDTS
jgi:Putative transposase